MKKIYNKYYVAFLSIIMAVLVGVIFIIAINFGINYFIKKQSIDAINNKIYYSKSMFNDMDNNIIGQYKDELIKKDLKSIFTVYEIDIQEYLEKRMPTYYLQNNIESSLFNYVSSNINNMKKYNIYHRVIDDVNVYFTYIVGQVKEHNQVYKYRIILYVDPYSVQRVIQILNIFFIVAFVIAVVSASIIGIKIGKRMEDSERKLRKFFSNASHELKTPLMSIQGYAEGLYTGVINNNHEASKIILDQSERMEKLVEELLLISKFESGYLKMNYITYNICELVDSVIYANNAIVNKNNINVNIKFSNNISEVLIDEKQFFKAIESVYTNAIKFTKNTIVVTVSENKNKVYISIRDNGSGISCEDMPHIFERFYYGKQGSTGVGLSLAKDIINMHNGNIEVKNDNGAEFIVSIPKA